MSKADPLGCKYRFGPLPLHNEMEPPKRPIPRMEKQCTLSDYNPAWECGHLSSLDAGLSSVLQGLLVWTYCPPNFLAPMTGLSLENCILRHSFGAVDCFCSRIKGQIEHKLLDLCGECWCCQLHSVSSHQALTIDALQSNLFSSLRWFYWATYWGFLAK